MFLDEQNAAKVFRVRTTSKQMVSFTIQLEQSILSGAQPFGCQLPFKKSGKPTAEDGSLFTTTMRDLTHRLKQLHFSALKITTNPDLVRKK